MWTLIELLDLYWHDFVHCTMLACLKRTVNVYPASLKYAGKMLFIQVFAIFSKPFFLFIRSLFLFIVPKNVLWLLRLRPSIRPRLSTCVYLHPQRISCRAQKPWPCLHFSSCHLRSLHSAGTRQAFGHFMKQANRPSLRSKNRRLNEIKDLWYSTFIKQLIIIKKKQLCMCEHKYCRSFQVYRVTWM